MDDTTRATVHGLLRDGARRWPDRELVIFEDLSTWTWTQAMAEATRAARVLADAGVGRDDRVQLLLPNGAGWLRAWWGATLLGAVVAPTNPAYRGQLLADMCDTIAPAVVVTDEPPVAGLSVERQPVVLTADELTAGPAVGPPVPDPESAHWETHFLLLTSGTTGPSKASITTNAGICHFAAWLPETCGVGADDVFQADMPWFHLTALGPVIQMMRVGGRFAVRTAPALSGYWAAARATAATFAIAPGTVAAFLNGRPPAESDRDHRMRFVLCSPLPPDPTAFATRFGLAGVCTAYGSTEASIPIYQALGTPPRPGSCGKSRPGFELRLVDAHDREVPAGEIGELIVRTDQPWLLSQGYLGQPDATVRAWRNGWLHTGDAMRMDGEGYFYFHDRYKDALRRRGENISSFDVEREVLAYPGVAEVACVAAPGEYGDDEVKVYLVPEPGQELDLEQLLEFLAERMTYFMVPRYFELIDALPKTPSLRVRKHLLREAGNTVATWDRTEAGYQITRAGLTRTEPVVHQA